MQYWLFKNGILIMVYLNPHIAVWYNPLYTLFAKSEPKIVSQIVLFKIVIFIPWDPNRTKVIPPLPKKIKKTYLQVKSPF